MVDFKKRITKKVPDKKVDPCEIYEYLDRESDKGPLRSVQQTILKKWYEKFSNKRDVILKLHTGQGKTLIGFLMLQSRLNQDLGPAVYLCPDNYLVEQTCKQAESFGINYTLFDGDGFGDFEDGKVILITTIHKLFHGESNFGIKHHPTAISTILMDDSHASIERIKDVCKITLSYETNAYQELLALFGPEIEKQGSGTYADILNGDFGSFLPVPYWDWQDKGAEIARILSKYKALDEIRFVWPILRDDLRDCLCVISGKSLEIAPISIPFQKFNFYYKASHRIFMSATLIDDAFFIKGLGLDASTILGPLCIEDEKRSGEKMVIIPSLIDEELNREEVVCIIGKTTPKKSGVVVLTPSFRGCSDWGKYGCIIASRDTIKAEIEKLKNKIYSKPLVIANRYDGIDLPDHSCRVLVIDSKPYSLALMDRYYEEYRRDSDFISKKIAQAIEQGLGRAVRGEKDYCVIILIGSDLVKFIKSNKTRKYFSAQTRLEIEVGLEIAKYAKDELESGEDVKVILWKLIAQSLNRDEGWKGFYIEKMNSLKKEKRDNSMLEIFSMEREAEEYYCHQDFRKAAEIYQKIIDKYVNNEEDRGWYLQEMARVIFPESKSESNSLQIQAHKKNLELLLPSGCLAEKLPPIGQKRIENIQKWLKKFTSNEDLFLAINDTLSKLRFGVNSDDFEKAFHELGLSLGFLCQRPDKEWKQGPDNLWNLKDGLYLLVECKSEVNLGRVEINKTETGQMNNSCAWFLKQYPGSEAKKIMIIPIKRLGSGAGFVEEVDIMRDSKLKRLVLNTRGFFNEFKSIDLSDVSEHKIKSLLETHKLKAEDFFIEYSEKPIGATAY